MKRLLVPFLLVLFGAGCLQAPGRTQVSNLPVEVTNFRECVAAGNPVMESYPRQCRHEGELYVEDIGNEQEKLDVIRLTSPRPNDIVTSPVTVTGEARGTWYFEARFPVVITDKEGNVLGQGFAQATGDWMTESFVPFTADVTFDLPPGSDEGVLILQKDNPSGLAENDDELAVPVQLE